MHDRRWAGEFGKTSRRAMRGCFAGFLQSAEGCHSAMVRAIIDGSKLSLNAAICRKRERTAIFRWIRTMGKGIAVKNIGWLGMALLLALPGNKLWATHFRPYEVKHLNTHIKGHIYDFTHNHGKDNRIWSRALQEKRDLYVYVPPGYDPHQRYPLIILMHGFAMDEKMMLRFVPLLDDAIVTGHLPPVIVAAPDGTLTGEPCCFSPGSFFLNSNAGDFEDFIIQDVWDFMTRHFPICPERQAHVLAGVSMGGFSAFNLGIRHRDGFGIVMGMFPPLNLRWTDEYGNYRAKFDPYHWGWRTTLNPNEVLARPFGVALRTKTLIGPLFGADQGALQDLTLNNPIELVDRTGLRNGELAMYVAYGGEDELNVDAQVESFLYLCKFRGLGVGVGYAPHGHHDMPTALRLFPGMFQWVAPLLAPYSPPLYGGNACASEACSGTSAPAQPGAAPDNSTEPPPAAVSTQSPRPPSR
jgi:pimeloyl-ACP methyl ester carboxylesterase